MLLTELMRQINDTPSDLAFLWEPLVQSCSVAPNYMSCERAMSEVSRAGVAMVFNLVYLWWRVSMAQSQWSNCRSRAFLIGLYTGVCIALSFKFINLLKLICLSLLIYYNNTCTSHVVWKTFRVCLLCEYEGRLLWKLDVEDYSKTVSIVWNCE